MVATVLGPVKMINALVPILPYEQGALELRRFSGLQTPPEETYEHGLGPRKS